jgi:AcrR family transcriptional regulator
VCDDATQGTGVDEISGGGCGVRADAVGRRGAPTRPRVTAYGDGRRALLDAAVRVVARRGLRHLTYRSLAEEAGVNNALVAHHFGSMDALLEEALQLSLQRSLGFTTTAPGTGDLDELFGGIVDMVAEHPDDQAFQYELTLEARRRPELAEHVARLYDAYRAALAAELATGGYAHDPDLVRLVIGAVDGLVFQQLCLGGADANRQALDRLRAILRSAV